MNQTAMKMTDIDPGTFWRAIGMRAIGASIAAAQDSDGPSGFLALSATQLSASPPMMTISVSKTTSALKTITSAGHFSINYLATEDSGLVDVFGGKAGISGAERFEDGRWDSLVTGAPTLIGALGVLDCEVVETIERFGAVLIIGRLVAFRADDGLPPLLSFRGKLLSGDLTTVENTKG